MAKRNRNAITPDDRPAHLWATKNWEPPPLLAIRWTTDPQPVIAPDAIGLPPIFIPAVAIVTPGNTAAEIDAANSTEGDDAAPLTIHGSKEA